MIVREINDWNNSQKLLKTSVKDLLPIKIKKVFSNGFFTKIEQNRQL